MEQQAYYRILDLDMPDKLANNCENTDFPLLVNCTGLYKMTRPYVTNIPRGRNDFYLQYCIDGTISVTTDGEPQLLSPGQIIILAPKTPYICKNLDDTVTYYWIHFTGADAAALLEKFELNCNKVHTVASSERIVRHFRALFREFLWRDRCFEDSAYACLISILAEFSRMRDISTRDRDTTVETIFKSLTYFHNHIHQPITVAQMAQIEHFSPSRYRTVFRRCMGMSPSEYMTKLRMHRACELLAMADMSVREVAEACGYPDQLYFSRVFRSHFHIAPSKYRGEDDLENDTEE